MNNKLLDRYTMWLLRKNIHYIFLLFVFILIILIYTPYQIYRFIQRQDEIHSIQREISDLRIKKDLILTFKQDEINQLVSVLQVLLPNQEDYFSILKTLNELSQKTGFIFSTYNMYVGKTDSERVELIINGHGSFDSLRAFLNQYRTGGGRLITIDSVEMSDKTTAISLSLNFYSRKSKNGLLTNPDIDKKLIEKLLQYKSRSNEFQIDETKVKKNEDIKYPINANPFGQ